MDSSDMRASRVPTLMASADRACSLEVVASGLADGRRRIQDILDVLFVIERRLVKSDRDRRAQPCCLAMVARPNCGLELAVEHMV